MVPKQLIVAVEGTAALGPYWKTIVSDYLDKIIRSFCGNDSSGQPPAPQVELSLVMFNAHGSYSACLVQRSGWTRDMDIFFQWLSAIPFSGGGFNDAAIAEGLAEAIMMFSTLNGSQNPNADGQRHCILIAASNPYPLPTPVYRPQPPSLEQSDSAEVQPDNRLSDAETLAKCFAQCGISLSVICPKKLPTVRAIYNAAKRNPRAADPPVDNVKSPHFLILISENFMEARAALGRSPGLTNMPTNQNPIKMDAATVPPISGPPLVSIPPANGSIVGRQPIPVGKNITPAPVKVEPTTVSSASGAAFPHISSVPRPTSQAVSSLQTSSPISVPQEIVTNNENVQDMKPLMSSLTSSLRPIGGGAPANVRILNDVAQARQVLAGGNSIGLSSMGGPPMLSNMISSGVATSVAPQTVISSVSSGVTSISGSLPIPATGQLVQNPGSVPFTSSASVVPGNPSLGMSQPLSNLQVTASMSQTLPGISQGNIPTQMMQTGISMNQNMTTSSGSTVMPSGTGAMMPTPGGTQQMQPGMQPVGVNNNNNVTNMPLNQQGPSGIQPPPQSKYVKVWEGNLSGQRQGQPVFITRLEGYRSASASETLAFNWPPTMQIVRLISQDHMNNKQYVGKADFLVFRAMDQHGFLGQLQEKKLCAVIQLPSQTLLLSVSDKAYRLIGMLFPGDMVVFKPQMPNQQQLQQLQQPGAQQQQIQQLQQQQQQQTPDQQQQQPLMQQIPQLQQQPLMQQQPLVGNGMAQAYMQGGAGPRSQLLGQGQVSSQGQPTMPGGNFMS
ncbi:mediator of RNA polymerase II transcription subunit 25-like isoform X2 [Andrographis paniculata]|uniref:mediator of RNA polymerase II transcription subunit 25-like isoform X2 n=1 Tax=Andrographis paniculata TaxID=175694 RepID=UPI0021E8DC76|nr:mediator of RNA polymerase II transcription subunit 25-like isoform X2 [Andrographis paniculata]